MPFVQNPIRRGFYPDPSICRAEGYYYTVHSTFSFAPGVPIFRSADLVTWEQIGHVLNREEQLPLDGKEVNLGIYAPTLRYHSGTFYMITTNVHAPGNFYVTAADPAGPWSDPVWLPEAEGFDPSLFFDGDTCWYVGTRTKRQADHYGDNEIWMRRLDLECGCLTGEEYVLWDGSQRYTYWPEGPHLYRRGDWYYLLIAECGTAFEHCITVARSRRVNGPYESCPNNPLLTHRHLGDAYPVQSVGHADLVEGPEGQWYAVLLATRPEEGSALLGRETFLARVDWNRDWSVFNAGEGKLRAREWIGREEERPERTETKQSITEAAGQEPVGEILPWGDPLDLRFLALRTLPESGRGTWFETKNGDLLLHPGKEGLEGLHAPAFLAVRLESIRVTAACSLDLSALADGCRAGLSLFFDESHFIALELVKSEGACSWQVRILRDGEETIGPSGACKEAERLELRVAGNRMFMRVGAADAGAEDVSWLCSERVSLGFTGCVFGVFAQSMETGAKCDAGTVKFGPLTIRES